MALDVRELEDRSRINRIRKLLDAADREALHFYLKTLSDNGFTYQIHYDVDYGCDERTGYSLLIGGSVYSQFKASMADAVRDGIRWFIELREDGLNGAG